MPSILDTVNKDAGMYFAVIATSQALAMIVYFVARVRFITAARV